jgi:hypothetical protein
VTHIASLARRTRIPDMVAEFDKAGIAFQYPDNWSLVEESVLDWPRTVSLQSPGGGLWSVMVYGRDTDGGALLQETLGEMRKEYSGLESSAITDQFEETSAVGHEMFFYCLDFLICARSLVVKPAGGDVLLVLWQAEDRDFANIEPVFRAITISLLRDRLGS